MGNTNSTSIPNENTAILPSEDQNGAGRKEHCMVCRKSTKINNFNQLKPGDHIEIPMFSKNWSPFQHHAIVRKIIPKSKQECATPLEGNGSQDGIHIAQVKVIDVPSAGDTCCQKYMPFRSGTFRIKSHTLGFEDEDTDDNEEGQDKDKDKTGQVQVQSHFQDQVKDQCQYQVRDQVKVKEEDKEIDCRKFTIKRVDYRRRRNSRDQTLENAIKMKKENVKENSKYNLCFRNCEHFCVAMVNQDAPTDVQNGKPQSIEKATCLQSTRYFWVFFHIILFILQYVLYYVNFELYAVYTQGNERYNTFLGNSSSHWLKKCYTGSNLRGFTTKCDWYVLLGFLGFYVLAYGILLIIQHTTRRKNVCNQCLISARIVFITKVIVFTGLEIFSILYEKHIYSLLEAIGKPGVLTCYLLFLWSSVELCIVLILVPHGVVKLLIYCKLRCCRFRPSKCSTCCSAVCCYPWDFDRSSHDFVINYA